MRSNGQPLFSGCLTHLLVRRIDPRSHNRLFDQRVGRNHVNRLRSLFRRQFTNSQPNQLQDRRRVLAAAVSNDPRHLVPLVQILDLVADCFDGFGQAKFGECRLFVPSGRCGRGHDDSS